MSPKPTSLSSAELSRADCGLADVTVHPEGTFSLIVYCPSGMHDKITYPSFPVIILFDAYPGPVTLNENPGSSDSPESHFPSESES